VRGSEFNDHLTADSLGDTLEGGGGNDILTGGAGEDAAVYTHAASAVTINLSLGATQVTGGAGTDTFSSIEDVWGSKFNDIITGDAGNNQLRGDTGSDQLYGLAGDDTLIGGGGSG